jgi:hypothetical protein
MQCLLACCLPDVVVRNKNPAWREPCRAIHDKNDTLSDQKKGFAMACDEGRTKNVLKWVLVTGNVSGSDREIAHRACSTHDSMGIQVALNNSLIGHDTGSLHAALECERERPGCLVQWGREILGM